MPRTRTQKEIFSSEKYFMWDAAFRGGRYRADIEANSRTVAHVFARTHELANARGRRFQATPALIRAVWLAVRMIERENHGRKSSVLRFAVWDALNAALDAAGEER